MCSSTETLNCYSLSYNQHGVPAARAWQHGHGSTGMAARAWQHGHGSTGMAARAWQHGHGSTALLEESLPEGSPVLFGQRRASSSNRMSFSTLILAAWILKMCDLP